MAEKILIIGSTGLVGSRFVELSPDLNLLTPTHTEFDLSDLNSIDKYLSVNQPKFIINFAAYTNVGEAEKQTGDKTSPCWQVNVVGTQNLLKQSTGIPLIHISTDMVFSGSIDDPGPYTENHPTESDPKKLTWYGYSKQQAEALVLSANQTIIRIIYPVRAKFAQKLDYLRLPLSLYSQGKLYPLFTDQQVSFTFIDELIDVLHQLISSHQSGIFHVSSDTFNPFDLVTYNLKKLGADTSVVKSSSVVEFLKTQPNPYRYPVKGGLSAQTTHAKLGLKFRAWQAVVDTMIEQGLKLNVVK